MSLLQLNQATGHHLHVLVATESEVCDQLWQWQRSTKHGVGRQVRGRKCLTLAALFDEFAAAWRFPYYFGENWDALDECLTDLEWLPAQSYLALVINAVHLLGTEPVDQRRTFWRLMERVPSTSCVNAA